MVARNGFCRNFGNGNLVYCKQVEVSWWPRLTYMQAGGRGVPGGVIPVLFVAAFVQYYFFIKYPRFTVSFLIVIVTEVRTRHSGRMILWSANFGSS